MPSPSIPLAPTLIASATRVAGTRRLVPLGEYDLAATLTSGQAFRWQPVEGGWESVVGAHWVRLVPGTDGIAVTVAPGEGDLAWLEDYLQTRVDLDAVVATFPDDPPMRAAVAATRGLRLLRQEPWECLASFILSSTKQITQIRQCVAALCARFGAEVATPAGVAPWRTFPTAERIAACTEAELRACKLGFRAPYLLHSARMVARGEVRLAELGALDCAAARAQLLRLPGVGRKIADCVLLFAYGFPEAFPVDVWVMRVLRRNYFRGRNVPMKRLLRFAATHFGPHAGYAQQYLFHHARVTEGRPKRARRKKPGARRRA